MKKLKIGKSNIHGKGLFSGEPIKKGELIAKVHNGIQLDPETVKYMPTQYGRFYNHDEKGFNTRNEIIGNHRYLRALKNIPANTELTANYREHPEMEQPEDFGKGKYASFDFDKTIATDEGLAQARKMIREGYNLFIISARDKVTPDMIARARKAGIPEENIIATGSDEAKVRKVKQLGVEKHFDDKPEVISQLGSVGQQFKKGGGVNSKRYTRSLTGTNKLFTKNKLFKKKSTKRIYDPNAKYYEDGGYVVEEYAKGGNAGCPPGSYWNGRDCVKVPKKKEPIIKKEENSKLTPEQQEYLKNKYAEAAEIKKQMQAGNPISVEMAKEFKNKYNESWTCPTGKCPPAEQQKPKEELETKKLPLLPPQLIDTSRGELQGELIEDNAPEYQMPYYEVERPYIYMAHHHSGQLIPHARPTLAKVRKPGMVSKALQKFTGYDPKYSEGYTDEEGNYIPGEFEKAQEEGRRVNFQGVSSLRDLKAQKKYNKAYDEYEGKQQFANALAGLYSLKKYGGEPNYIELELDDDKINEYRKGGYVVEDISVAPLKKFTYQDGGELYTVPGSNSVYRKVNGKWEVDWNKSGNFQPLSKGDVKQRSAILDKQAKPYYDRDYSDMLRFKNSAYSDTKTKQPPKTLTKTDKKAQENFDKNFNVTKEDNFTQIKNQIEKDKKAWIQIAKEKGYKVTQQDLDEIEERGWNTLGGVGTQRTVPTIGGNTSGHISTAFPENAGFGDYVQRDWEYLTNPFTAFEYAVSGGGAENMPYNINQLRVDGIDPGVVEGRNLVGNVLNATTNLFDAGDKVVRNVGEGNYGMAALEAMRFLPGARVQTGLGSKAGKYLTTQTPLKNAYNLLPEGTFSGYSKLRNANKSYRVAGMDAYDDGVLEATNLNLEELRRIYHNSERFLMPEEARYLHKHGHGLRENYRTDMSNFGWGTDQWNVNNQLPPPPSEIQFMPDGTTRTVYNQQPIVPTPEGGLFGMTREQTEAAWRNIQNNPNWQQTWGTGNWNPNTSTFFKPKPVNKSGLTKEEVLQKASAKDKDAISKMSETEFENTVLKPNGEIVPYYQGSLESQFSGSQNVTALSPKQYADEFNSRLDLLNDIIAQRNKSGVEYRVKGLDESGRLTFYTPPGQKGKNPLIKKGLEDIEIPAGESIWGVRINPGQWRGNVENIANTEYFRSIPGLEMSNTTAGVFADHVPRRGTGAYDAINEYLKRLDLGRVKPGFNSQTDFSRGAWENFIKSGRGVGFYGNPNTIYGTMKSVFPYIGVGYLGYEGLQGTEAMQQERDGGSINKLQYGKYGGQFKLGDKVDEATMKKLKKLGYTFKKL